METTFLAFARTYLQSNFIVWVFLSYALVVVAMAADLVGGIRKARRLGRKCNSRGFKQTCDKAMKYFLPMICLTSVDILASITLSAPYLTLVFGVYCIFCEVKSLMESVADKEEFRKQLLVAENLFRESDLIKFIIENLIKKYEDNATD